jgi:hypothetical protein
MGGGTLILGGLRAAVSPGMAKGRILANRSAALPSPREVERVGGGVTAPGKCGGYLLSRVADGDDQTVADQRPPSSTDRVAGWGIRPADSLNLTTNESLRGDA